MDKKTELRASCASPEITKLETGKAQDPSTGHCGCRMSRPGHPRPGDVNATPPRCQGSGHRSALSPLSLSPAVSSQSPVKPQDPRASGGGQAVCQGTSGSKGKKEEKNNRMFSFSWREGPWGSGRRHVLRRLASPPAPLPFAAPGVSTSLLSPASG